jgi:DnaK suppressor protein
MPMQEMPRLTGKKKKHYLALMQAREIVMGQFQFHKSEALDSQKGSSGEHAGMASHMADIGTDNFLHDIKLNLLSEEGDTIELIDEAIQRLINGEFGKCLDCRAKIPQERLETKPFARYCINCKSLREQNNGLNPNYMD